MEGNSVVSPSASLRPSAEWNRRFYLAPWAFGPGWYMTRLQRFEVAALQISSAIEVVARQKFRRIPSWSWAFERPAGRSFVEAHAVRLRAPRSGGGGMVAAG